MTYNSVIKCKNNFFIFYWIISYVIFYKGERNYQQNSYKIWLFGYYPLIQRDLIVCYYHVTYVFQGETALCTCLNIKQLFARNRRDIWTLSDNCRIQIHNHLVRKRAVSPLVKLANGWVFVYKLSDCGIAVTKGLALLHWFTPTMMFEFISAFNFRQWLNRIPRQSSSFYHNVSCSTDWKKRHGRLQKSWCFCITSHIAIISVVTSRGGGKPIVLKCTFITHTTYLPILLQLTNPKIRISKCKYRKALVITVFWSTTLKWIILIWFLSAATKKIGNWYLNSAPLINLFHSSPLLAFSY